MHGVPARDGDLKIDWSPTAADYAAYRPGPPESFYVMLQALGVGVAGQRILDLGTGTGVLARRFARAGASVMGIDIAPGQIEAAAALAAQAGLTVDWRVAGAESVPAPDGVFDAVTANQCWLYFDRTRALAEVRRLLKPGGRLITSHFSWVPRQDEIARLSEALVLKHNPQWSAADWSGEVPPVPAWLPDDMAVVGAFWYDEMIPFTHASWRGRMRACRGVGATLGPEAVRAFDEDLARLLADVAPPTFEVRHRIDAHVVGVRHLGISL